MNPPAMIAMVFDIKCCIKAKPTHLDVSIVRVLYCDYPAQGLPSHFVLQVLSIPTVSVILKASHKLNPVVCVLWKGTLPFFPEFSLSQSSLPLCFPSIPFNQNIH